MKRFARFFAGDGRAIIVVSQKVVVLILLFILHVRILLLLFYIYIERSSAGFDMRQVIS